MKFHLLIINVVLLLLIHGSTTVSADPLSDSVGAMSAQIQELTNAVKDLHETVQSQGARIQALEGENTTLRAQVRNVEETQSETIIASNTVQQTPQGLNAFNPEIGVVVDVVTEFTENNHDEEGHDKVSVRELELVFGHEVDPMTRLDVTLAYSDYEHFHIEEAYITWWGLPYDIKTRLGRMRPKVGKASALHRDSLETVDEPLVVSKYLGHEGYFRTGLELSWYAPVPWEVWTHEITAGVLEGGAGHEGEIFGDTRRIPSAYAHVANFWEISPETNLELGATYLTGSSDDDMKMEVRALGLDATLYHYFNSINRVKLQSEFYFQDRDEADFDDDPWGFYALADYRFLPRWDIGGRYDYVMPVEGDAANPNNADVAYNAYLTFHQSEFARWRVQYQHLETADGEDEDKVFLQGTFAIGAHKHQIQ